MERDTSPRAMSPGLAKVVERARREPETRLWSLAHHIDVDALRRAFDRVRASAAVGVDGVTKEAYGRELESNLQELHRRMKAMQYRHRPIRRAHIPKGKGKTRPIGISCIEDKVVQGALHELLELIYEQTFLDCSYGFRPGRSAHDALRALDRAIHAEGASWVLEFDIATFFDSVDRALLREMLLLRFADLPLMRLIGKCLHVGILDGEELTTPTEGTVQGSVLSPLLGNVYLHHVLDLWFEHEVKPRLSGKSVFVRYADDGVMCFERREDAERVLRVLGQRLERFGLRLHPDKTRLLDMRRPPSDQQRGKGSDTLDFLGFTLYWGRSRKGRWVLKQKTRSSKMASFKRAIDQWCRRHRHLEVREQHAALARRIQGHFNYFGVRGNVRSLGLIHEASKRSWFKWLNRRSQRSRMTWQRFVDLLDDLPLPPPMARTSLWAVTP